MGTDLRQCATVCTHGDFYSAASLAQQAAGTMTCYPMQSHYPDTEQIKSLPSPNNAEHQARRRQVSILKSLV